MKKIVFAEITQNIHFNDINEDSPIFAKRDGKLYGMVIYEEGNGWILRTGGKYGSYGFSDHLKACLEKGMKEFNYEFFVE